MTPRSLPPLPPSEGVESAGAPPSDPHFPDLAAYALGSLGPEETAAFERQLAECETCQQELPRLRESVASLAPMPVELLLDGPPAENVELLIRRTVRQIRSEPLAADSAGSASAASAQSRLGSTRRRPGSMGPRPGEPPSLGSRSVGRRDLLVAAAAAVLLVGAGATVGRQTAPRVVAEPPVVTPTQPSDTAPPVPGTRQATAVDASTGARLTVSVIPATGWVRVTAAASGIKAGQRCRLMVVSKHNVQVEAGSWLVSAKGAAQGTTLEGSALIAPDDVAAVRVQNDAGDVLVNTEV
jgi:anti-sigma factor RsiW